MLKPIEKIVFTSTGEIRCPNYGEFYSLQDGSIFKCVSDDYEVRQNIYTKSIELVQPNYNPDKNYYYIANNNGKITVFNFSHRLMRFEDYIDGGNIYETKEGAQKVADEINLLIQEKGYFTLYPEKE